MSETIFALATAAGRAAIAVVRVSGPQTAHAVVALSGSLPTGRLASLRTLRNHAGEILDRALVLWFPGPASYTGEDVAEFHVHGGVAVVDAVITALAKIDGLRLAEPGEFTRRAFEHGRLDLAQAEAVADLIDAETSAQRVQALEQLDGALSRRHEHWRGLLLDASAWLEAAVDFPDEDLPEVLEARAGPALKDLARELDAAIADVARGQRIRSGYRVALVGAPNAGKSTLLNALTGRDAAIVSPVAGTTRDVIEVPLVLNGHSVLLADTAGLRDALDEIETEGVRRAQAWSAGADLRLWVVDATAPSFERPAEVTPTDMLILNKIDEAQGHAAVRPDWAGEVRCLSALDGGDVSALRVALGERVVADVSGAEFPSATRQRHSIALIEARDALRAALANLDSPELASEEVRRAAFVLHRITGSLEVEQVLGRVFSSFCIGK